MATSLTNACTGEAQFPWCCQQAEQSRGTSLLVADRWRCVQALHHDVGAAERRQPGLAEVAGAELARQANLNGVDCRGIRFAEQFGALFRQYELVNGLLNSDFGPFLSRSEPVHQRLAVDEIFIDVLGVLGEGSAKALHPLLHSLHRPTLNRIAH
jgi:hypothetical protein